MSNNQNPKKEHESEIYLKIQKKVSRLKDFYLNLMAYSIVIPLLFFLDWYANNSSVYSQDDSLFRWAYWPALGWGIALIFQALDIFVGSRWEEKMIEKEFEKHNKNSQN